MSIRKTLVCAVILGSFAPLVFAQKPTEQPAERGARFENTETAVVPLSHGWCGEISKALRELGLPVRSSCGSATMLILHGPAEQVEKVRDQLIPLMDRPDVSRESEANAFIQLAHQPTEDLLALLHTAAPGRTTRIALDELSRMLVVHASEAEIDAIRQLVEQVDKPTESLIVYAYFIRAGIESDADPEDNELPRTLAPVAKTLAESGFGEMTLMAPVMVTVDEGRVFQQESVLKTQGKDGVGDDLRFLVEGIAHLDSENGIVQLEVKAAAQGKYTNSDLSGGGTEFEVSTTVVAKVGAYVILAAAPASTADGDAIAVAVRITRD